MFYILLAVVVFAVDFATKFLAKAHLAENASIPLIDGVFHLTYVENRGAAFGIMQGGGAFFVIIAFVLAIAVVWLLRKYKQRHVLMNLGLGLLCAGALGNTVDRVMQGYVVDFFDFRLIDFPVFNVADISVCVGAFLLAVFFVFFDEKIQKNEAEENDKD